MAETPTLYDLIQPRQLKRKMYLVVLPVIALAASIESLLEVAARGGATPGSSARACLALVALTGALVVWRWPHFLRAVEYAIYGLLCVGFLAQIQRTLLGSEGSANILDQMLRTSPWVPMVLILGFVVFETKRALIAVLTFYLGGLVCLGVYMWNVEFPAGDFGTLNTLLQQFVLFNIVYIALLYVLGTLRERSLEQVIALARTDALTEIPNRLYLQQIFPEEKTRAERYRRPLAAILIDVDQFKRVNDTIGHQQGDKVLKRMAQVLRQQARTCDKIFRWGGEEFLVLAVETDGRGAGGFAERLRQAIAATPFETPSAITASFGVAEFRPGDTLETLTERADDALYAAKAAGRNCVRQAPGISFAVAPDAGVGHSEAPPAPVQDPGL